MPACASNFVKVFFKKLPSNIYHAQDLCVLSPSPAYNFHTEYPPKVDPVPLGSFVANVPIMMLGLLKNIKRGLMGGLAYLLFVNTESSHGGGS